LVILKGGHFRGDNKRGLRSKSISQRLYWIGCRPHYGAFAPYALMELVLPGGSVMALLLWLYRRQRKVPAFASQEILSFL
jgi:hypothetical protein